MHEGVKFWIEGLAVAIEGAAALVIGLAVIRNLYQSLPLVFRVSGEQDDLLLDYRLRLGRWLAVALELTLAADILRTAVAPTWDEIGKLSAIAVLRTALNYFLEREIRRTEKD